MKRTDENLSHLIYSTLKIGFMKPIDCIEILPGDTLEMSVEGGLRMAPLRSPLLVDPHVHLSAYFVKHRHCYNHTTTGEWEDFIKEGYQYDGVGTVLDRITPVVGGYSFLPNTEYATGSSTIPAHLIRGINMIWNFYWRIANVTDEIDIDSTDHNYVKREVNPHRSAWGLYAARLPEFWNTGLDDASYDAENYATLATASADITLMDIAAVQGEYQSEIMRDWYDLRYKEHIEGGWGVNGVTADAADGGRPEILAVSEGFLSGVDISATSNSGGLTVGESQGASKGAVSIYIPPRYFKEAGMVWLVACIRYPSILQEQIHYLRGLVDLDYENFSGDPRVMATKKPVALDKEHFVDSSTSSDDWGTHPWGQWFRTHPHVVDRQLRNIAGMPFLDETGITTDDRRFYCVSSFHNDDDYFGNTSWFGGGHALLSLNNELYMKRTIADPGSSIYAGAHLN